MGCRHQSNFLQGVPTIRRAIINIKEKDDTRGKKGDKELLVEGYGLQKVMTTQGMPQTNLGGACYQSTCRHYR